MRRVMWQHWFPWLIYGLLYPFLGQLVFGDNIRLRYPLFIVCRAVISYGFNWPAVIVHAFRLPLGRLRIVVLFLFPASVLELVVGMGMDAVMPKDYNLLSYVWNWVANSAMALICASPAYVVGFLITYRSRSVAIDRS